MKWTYSIKNKVTASVLLVVVLGLVLLNNIDERQNSDKLRSAFETMYKDRMVVEGYIFDLSEKVHSIQSAIDSDAREDAKQEVIYDKIAEIQSINKAYSQTYLTEKEASEFNLFTNAVSGMENHAARAEYAECKRLSSESLGLLYSLSKIQLAEADRVKKSSDSILNYGKTSSQFEMAVLIVIAIIIQAMVFSSLSLQNFKNVRAPSLN